jgi:hypothetical protein
MRAGDAPRGGRRAGHGPGAGLTGAAGSSAPARTNCRMQAEAASPALAGCDTLTDFRDTRPMIGPRCVVRCHNRGAVPAPAYRNSSASRRPQTRTRTMSGPRYPRSRAAGRPAPASRDGMERSRPHVAVWPILGIFSSRWRGSVTPLGYPGVPASGRGSDSLSTTR